MSSRNPEINVHFLRDLNKLPEHDSFINVGLVCFDAENVVVPFGEDTLFPGVKETIRELQSGGVNTCMLTNMTDGERAKRIAGELGTASIHKGMVYDLNKKVPSKTEPTMFELALEHPGLGSAGTRAVMVDDQLKNALGARKVDGITDYFWTFPKGIKQHLGVALVRPIEVPVGLGIIGKQQLMRFKNGTYGEW